MIVNSLFKWKKVSKIFNLQRKLYLRHVSLRNLTANFYFSLMFAIGNRFILHSIYDGFNFNNWIIISNLIIPLVNLNDVFAPNCPWTPKLTIIATVFSFFPTILLRKSYTTSSSLVSTKRTKNYEWTFLDSFAAL